MPDDATHTHPPADDRQTVTHRGAADPPADPWTLPQIGPPPGMGLPTVPGYELLEQVGQGGMGVVFRARQVSADRVVAVKLLLAGELAGTAARERFRAEAAAAARLSHPNVVQLYEAGEADGRAFLSCEFVPGGSLAAQLDGTPWDAGRAARLVVPLARAVAAAHRAGIVHRDLKPGNVLLAADGTPKVTDFGIAKRLDGDSNTSTGAVLGTPSYMAPEQAGSAGTAGPAADVYGLGAIQYELLTGRPPFKGKDFVETLDAVRTREPVPPRDLSPSLPRDVETVCLKCLRKEPGRRYASADALADDLERFLAGRPVQARRVGRVETAWKWVRRNRAVAGLLAAVFLSLTAVAGVSLWFNSRLRSVNDEQRELLRAAARREGELAVEKAMAFFDDNDRNAGLLWAARGVHLLEESGATAEEQRLPRMLLSLWGQQHQESSFGSAHDMRARPQLHLLPDGTVLLGEGADSAAPSLGRYDTVTGQRLTAYALDPGEELYYDTDFENDRLLAYSGTDVDNIARVRLYELRSGKLLRAAALPEGDPRRRWWTGLVRPRGASAAILPGPRPGIVRIWDVAADRVTGEIDLRVGDQHGLTPIQVVREGVTWTTKGHVMLAPGSDGAVRLWKLPSGDGPLEIRHPGPGSKITWAEFTTGEVLITAGTDGAVRQWDVGTGRPTAEPLTFDKPDIAVKAFNPARKVIRVDVIFGERTATGYRGFDTETWNLASRTKMPNNGDVRTLNPDGRTAFDADRLILVETGRTIGRRSRGGLVGYTTDGRFALFECQSREPGQGRARLLRIYSTEIGREFGPPILVYDWTFSPDPDRITSLNEVFYREPPDHRPGFRHMLFRPLDAPAKQIVSWAEAWTRSRLDERGEIVPLERPTRNYDEKLFPQSLSMRNYDEKVFPHWKK